jgi:hypothetical protein
MFWYKIHQINNVPPKTKQMASNAEWDGTNIARCHIQTDSHKVTQDIENKKENTYKLLIKKPHQNISTIVLYME